MFVFFVYNKYYYKYIEWNQTYRIIKKRSNYEIISYYKGFNYKRIIKSLNDVQIDINLNNNKILNNHLLPGLGSDGVLKKLKNS